MPAEELRSEEPEAVKLLKDRLSRFETEEGRLKGLAYVPRANDVAISTTPKAGTTWMQQICHQLRSQGDMNFDEISSVVPWLELAWDQGQDLEAPQFGQNHGMPRFFKTHAWAEHCPNFPKTIVVLRHPYDVLLSFFNFFEGWFFESGTISIETFADHFWLARGVPSSKMQNASYFVHLLSWIERRKDENVLIVFFEDLKEDLKGEVDRISKFVSTTSARLDTAENIACAVRNSSYEFMKSHESQFDERLSKVARNEACGLDVSAGMNKTKIHKGNKGQGKALPVSLRHKIDEKWKQLVEPATGFATYDDLREAMR